MSSAGGSQEKFHRGLLVGNGSAGVNRSLPRMHFSYFGRAQGIMGAKAQSSGKGIKNEGTASGVSSGWQVQIPA